jgi:hypothetical protein
MSNRITLAAVLLLAVAPLSAAPPKLSTTASPPTNPIVAAQLQLSSDVATYSATGGSLAAIQAQLTQLNITAGVLTTSLSTLQTTVDADYAALKALINPNPTPTPAGHVVSILAVTSPATCAPCKKLDPVLTALKASGVNVTTLDGNDPTVLTKWNVASIPTLIMQVDSAEENGGKTPGSSRMVGFVGNPNDQAILAKWYADTVAWAKTLPPK